MHCDGINKHDLFWEQIELMAKSKQMNRHFFFVVYPHDILQLMVPLSSI